MRLLDQEPMDPDIAEELAAIDATLAGEPVDPRHAELAELALMLRAERPPIDDGFARRLDGRVERRFAVATAPKKPAHKRFFSRTWVWAPTATAAALAASIAVVLMIGSGPAPYYGGNSSSTPSTALTASTGEHAAAPSTAQQLTRAAAAPPHASLAGAGRVSPGAQFAPVSPAPGGLTPPNTGRKIVQGAQLALTTVPNQIDKVSQELYNVVGFEGGIVRSSQVTQTGGLDGTATFQLSIPSSHLSDAMAKLSQLPNSHVASRTDQTQDVTDQYNGLTNRLNDARALRTALLKQLAAAVTTQQIDSLKQQIHDADSEIAYYQNQIGGLTHQINYSQVAVTISAAAVAVPQHQSGGFTIGKAFHTAKRVLTVAAGVALIGLAALLPVALVIALIWWIWATLRRRRREHALDLA